MGFKERYERAKEKLLNYTSICKENRDLFKEFFEFEEYKLKRQNRLSKLDEPCYRTLCGYLGKLKNVNIWFCNKPWKDITKKDVKKVYDDLEDGKITNRAGKAFADKSSYYSKIFKSKPFRLAGKSELAKDVIEFSSSPEKEVRFITEETFMKMISVLSKPKHFLLFWLAWDIGENIGALLQLTKNDFIRQNNMDTKEVEYLVNLPKSKIKRSRKSRSEPTLYKETVKYLDIVLDKLNDNDLVFPFGHRQALKIMHSVVKRTGAKCEPNNDSVKWKDLRSGMACHLLRSGWSKEEVDARLGHTPGSKALNAYLDYTAIDRNRPKKKLYDSNLEKIQNELEEAKKREKLHAERIRRQGEENDMMKIELENTRDKLKEIENMMRIIANKIMV